MSNAERDSLWKDGAAASIDLVALAQLHSRLAATAMVRAKGAEDRGDSIGVAAAMEEYRTALEAIRRAIPLQDGADKALRAKAGAARGGRRGAQTRQQDAVDEDAVLRAAKIMGWPAVTSGVNKRLALRFDRTPERIGQILRAEKKRNKGG